MTIAELRSEIVRCGGDARAIYTGDGNPEDRYAIVWEAQLWKVYYSERGEQLELREFNSENEACEYLFRLLEKDQTIWGKNSG